MTEQPLTTSETIYEMWRLQDNVDSLLAEAAEIEADDFDYSDVFTPTGIDLQWNNRKRDGDGTVVMATPAVRENSVAELYRAVANQPATPSAELFMAGVEVLMQEIYPEEQKHVELETN